MFKWFFFFRWQTLSVRLYREKLSKKPISKLLKSTQWTSPRHFQLVKNDSTVKWLENNDCVGDMFYKSQFKLSRWSYQPVWIIRCAHIEPNPPTSSTNMYLCVTWMHRVMQKQKEIICESISFFIFPFTRGKRHEETINKQKHITRN